MNKDQINNYEPISKRYEYYLRMDIEAIKSGIMIAYSNNERSFTCSRFCKLLYIKKISESLKNIFIDSDIILEKNHKNTEYYTIKIYWTI
jgi:hypothetical protein